MIICTKCGFQNEDSDTFCGSCAAFLEWAGEKQAVEPEPEPVVEPEPEPVVEPGLFERVKERIVGVGEARTMDPGGGAGNGAEPAAEAASVPEPAPVAVSAEAPAPLAVAAQPAAVSALASSVTDTRPPAVTSPTVGAGETNDSEVSSPASAAPVFDRAAGPVTSAPSPGGPAAPPASTAVAPGPVAPAQPAPVAPGPVAPTAVKPGTVRARPTAKAKAPQQRVVNPGDLICGQCGEGNDPVRRFCRRCGASLQQAVAFAPPWYKRLIHRLRKRKVRAAGERPRQRRRAFGGAGGGWISSLFTKVVALAIIVLVVLTFVGPFHNSLHHRFSGWYHDVANAIHTTYNPVHPIGATATSSAPGHPPTYAIDNASNTSWEAGGSRSGVGESLTVTLQSPSNIDKIGFINGDNDTPSAYLTEPRLETVLLTFKGASPYTKTITLKDTATFQSYSVSAKKVTSLSITIESVYASAQGQNAALTEVELFQKS